ncbi:hypothetical protein [Bradyrhizobium cosmicum]|uniref:hypothetical protein n=1 Tax=Bradyrhizobium cosmicum TaxID=1404864 RepID=UPI0002E8D2E0|nr:hypothetical protein [Bradyrhizobium cosmicum]
MTRLRTCRCGAEFLPRQRQKSCSPDCARRARPPRSPRPSINRNQPIVLRLLKVQPLERRARGGWRFGTKRISDALVDSLIASGRAEIRGGRLHHVEAA